LMQTDMIILFIALSELEQPCIHLAVPGDL
jgi:hypothetical protein